MPFEVRITGIPDFVAFVALVRGKDLTAEEIQRIVVETAELNRSSSQLESALNDSMQKHK